MRIAQAFGALRSIVIYDAVKCYGAVAVLFYILNLAAQLRPVAPVIIGIAHGNIFATATPHGPKIILLQTNVC